MSRPFYQVRLPDQDAWFAATAATLFNGTGMLLDLVLSRKILGVPAKPLVVSSVIGFVLAILLFASRKTASVKWASISFSINTASVLTALLWTDLQFARAEPHWVPFQATKLGCLVAAMLAPAFWVGLLNILAYTFGALIQFEYFFPDHFRVLASAEPIPILAFGLAGIVGLIYRFGRVRVEQELARIQAQNFALKRLTHAFLDIRNRMNTPLQVIELSIDLLRNSCDCPKTFLDPIDHSLQGLREINSVLVEHEKRIDLQTRR